MNVKINSYNSIEYTSANYKDCTSASIDSALSRAINIDIDFQLDNYTCKDT